MKTKLTKKWMALLCVGGALSIAENANAITITSLTRSATLDAASAGASGNGNSTEADVNAEFGTFAPWTLAGDFAGTSGSSNGGTDGLLTVSLTSGTWGNSPASGTWTLHPNYWLNYGQAVISIHVGGNINQLPDDHFDFLITQGETSGTWSFTNGTEQGGGLSNLRLFRAGDTGRIVTTPDGGTTIVSLGIALLGLGSIRKLIVSKG